MPSLEDIYLFRHAAYRDVAYELQLPSERARLHAAAFQITESVWAGEAALVAAELAEHARLGQDGASSEMSAILSKAELRYLQIAMQRFDARAQWENLLHAADRALCCPECLGEVETGVLANRAIALQNLGRREPAVAAWLATADSGHACGHHRLEVEGLCTAGVMLANFGRHDEAGDLVDRAEHAARASGDDALLARCYMDRAMVANVRGRVEENERMLLRAAEVFPDKSDSPTRWMIRGNLANMYANTGRRDLAIDAYIDLIDEMRKQGNRRLEAVALANLGRQYLVGGDLEAAETSLVEAVEIAVSMGNLRSVGFALAQLATLDLRRGNFARAEASVDRAIDIAREYGLVVYHAAYRSTWALLQLLQGHERAAQEAAEDARSEFNSVGGEAFIAEFCAIVRLRIAAWQAVAEAVPGRRTSRLRLGPPSSSWLAVMQALSDEIQLARREFGARAAAGLIEAADAAEALVAEMTSAVAEQRPALVFRGYLPSEMRPELRRALLQRLAAAEEETLRKLHPELWAALTA